MNDATQFFDTAAGAGGGYEIERSLRFNQADSAQLSRTFGSAGNRQTWTWAGWVKVVKPWNGSAGAIRLFHSWTAAYNRLYILFNRIYFDQQGTGGYSNFGTQSDAILRDPSAWMHVVVSVDVTQATAANRVKYYINGVFVPNTAGSTYPPQNTNMVLNDAANHDFGLGDGYLADVHFIDGQALDPTSFGEFDANGVWQPKAYTGTYGTNGFHLDFSDNSTAAALGTDTSGNSNTWTVNNISVAAGAGNDSLVDSPTNYGTDTGAGGEVRGNYATLNPLDLLAQTLANGNLQASGSTDLACVTGTIGVTSGKWYWEVTAGSNQDALGIWSTSSRVTSYPGGTSDSYCYYANTGSKYNSGSASAYGASFTVNDIIGVALDLDAGTLTFYKNNVSQGVAFSGLTGGYRPAVRAGSSLGASTATYVNFGQRPFAYTAPSGFKALCTTNLPEPTIADGSTVMDVALYTGNGSTQTISGLGFSPDLVWVKSRSSAQSHILADTVRGANKALISNLTIDEQTGYVSAFNSDGFDVDSLAAVNYNTATYVAWTWDAGSSTVTNTDGTISSQVRANASAGFSVVTYTGNGTAGSTIGHGLGVAPELIICKSRSNTGTNWAVYHQSIGATHYLYMNTTSAAAPASVIWNNTAPSSTAFTVGTNTGVNQNTYTYVAYCFAPVAGYSAFGSYTGNGSANGPFVYTGFRPRWVLIKAISTGTSLQWRIFDTARDSDNDAVYKLYPNLSLAENGLGGESTATNNIAILSNGFRLTTTYGETNNSGTEYIYAAFAEHPFKYSRAR